MPIRDQVSTARCGVTLGDPAGIGAEVLRAALRQTRIAEHVAVELFLAAELVPWWQAQGDEPGLRLVPVEGLANQTEPPTPGQPTATGRAQAFRALAAMADAAAARRLDVMVTGPVPKAIFDHLKPRPPGQTEFLAARLGAPRFAMMLAGPRLRVVPVTTHVPLRDVAGLLTTRGIVDAALAATDALVRWHDIATPRLAVCGLNPHAGEGGLVGDEEARIIAPAVAELQRLGVAAEGPVVADSVFHHALEGRYDVVLCMYHDQALGPLKTVHFHDACNITCGLTVPRISPDHGTAYDIAGRGIANPASMIHALQRAEQMARRGLATTPSHRQETPCA